jgi:hypothetical protein
MRCGPEEELFASESASDRIRDVPEMELVDASSAGESRDFCSTSGLLVSWAMREQAIRA